MTHPVTNDVTVVIPTLRSRNRVRARAIQSVVYQTLRPAQTFVEFDYNKAGSAETRNGALPRITSEFMLCLDDDDQLTPHAVQLLVEAQRATGADVVSGAAWIPQQADHREPTEPLSAGWIPVDLVQECSRLTVTSLMRTELVRQVGGFEWRPDPVTGMLLDDYGLYWKLANAGSTFYRIPETILIWNIHGANTSGKPR